MSSYEVVYSAALERQAAEATRRAALASAQLSVVADLDARPNDGNAADLVRDYIARYPNCGMREIAIATCLSWQGASRAIYALHASGVIESPSIPKREGMRWRCTEQGAAT